MLDETLTRIRRDLLENRRLRQRHEAVRSLFHSTTWAREAATLYQFVSPESLGIASMAPLIVPLMEFPSMVLVSDENIPRYADYIAEHAPNTPAGNAIMPYEAIFHSPAFTTPSLVMVEHSTRLIETLQARGKDVHYFYRWAVGDYPLPNLHTYLIFQKERP